jgi:hypothetical protein
MADYDLSRLSSRSFEQLVQAIAVKIFGPGIIIFGDGPDGGREATFDGPQHFPHKGAAWNGYGIFQAKFLQKPSGPTRDTVWFLDQLQKELKKFTDRKRGLRQPEYYIIATNVSLSSVHKRGGKDKTAKIFRDFKKNNARFKDYRIWDADQIRTFLDGQADIRRAYAAWITTGDVLSEVISAYASKPDFETAIANFLQKELLADQFVNLEQAGHAADERTPLARVFIDLPVTKDPNVELHEGHFSTKTLAENSVVDRQTHRKVTSSFLNEILHAASQKLNKTTFAISAGRREPDREHGNPEPGRFVLLGGPGQGKTTAGQFLCQLFRSSILRQRAKSTRTPEVQQVLQTIEKQCKQESIDYPCVQRFPIRIVLNHFAAELASLTSESATSLLRYILKRIKVRTDIDISVQDFKKWLSTYPWVLVLDGLDEVPASSNRDAVMSAIRDFWIDANDCDADILVLATTRPQGYSQEFSPQLYQHRWLIPLTPSQALHYASRLVEARYGGDQDRKDRIMERLQRATSEDATTRLMQSPLQVTIMTTLVDQVGHPPQERWRLFQQYYEVIYRREMERGIPASTILRDYRPDIDAIHRRVGLLIQVESELSGRTNARLSLQSLSEIVESRLQEEEHATEELRALKKSILDAAMNRLVFLVGLEANEAGFEIRSLQEFMAAEALMDGSDDLVQRRLRAIAPAINWRNVMLFAAGKCFVERQHLRDTVHTICAELNDDLHDKLAQETLLGSQLALDLLDDGSARRQPRYSQILARQALRLLDLPPSEWHSRLVNVYEGSLDRIFIAEIAERLNNRPLHKTLTSWLTLSELAGEGVSWAIEMANKCWPAERSEQISLCDISALNGLSGEWIKQREIELLPQVDPGEHIMWTDPFMFYDVTQDKKPPEQNLPAWWSLIYDLQQERRGFEVTFKTAKARIRGVKLRIKGIEPPNQRLIRFSKEFPKQHHLGWEPIIGAGRFLREPTKDSLAREIHSLADLNSIKGHRWLLNALPIPWPFSVLSRAGNDANELRTIANKVGQGLFGDHADWVAAEERWRSRGITQEDIIYTTSLHGLFDHKIGQIGCPFYGPFGYFLLRKTEAKESINELISLYREINDPIARLTISRWILSGLASWGQGEIMPAITITAEDVRKIVDDNKDLHMDLSALCGLQVLSSNEKNWIDILDYIGSNTRGVFMSGSGGSRRCAEWLTQNLTKIFSANAEKEGIFALIGGLMRSGISADLPTNVIDGSTHILPAARAAALTISLINIEVWKKDPVILAQETIECAKILRRNNEEEWFLQDVLLAIRRQPPTGMRLERYMIRLLELVERENWRDTKAVIDAMDECLRRRVSALADPTTWKRLGLPEGIKQAVVH